MWRKLRFPLAVTLLLSLFIWIGKTATTTRLPGPLTPPSFYSNHCRDDLEMTFAKAINRAEESIHLSIYTLTDPRVLRALNQAAERERKITILFDAKHAYGLKKKLHPSIEQLGQKLSGLMHQKILVIDGKEVWIGSANMTPDSLRKHGNLVIALDSPLLGKTLIESISNRNTRAPPEINYTVHGQPLEYYQLPKNKQALGRLIQLLDEAETSLQIAMFTWTHPKLTDAVIRAYNRGLDVQIVIDRHSGKGASRKTVQALQEANVPVRISNSQGLLHHKLALIDHRTLVCGSANWTKSAFTRNEDCFLILHDLNDDQKHYLKKLWHVIKLESNLKL